MTTSRPSIQSSFSGVDECGYGAESGLEAADAAHLTIFVTQLAV